ncbi:BatD family protein [Vibrio sp. SCSIO 43136]|uniref:BatD family protein n=1 Tax=Vibrio sp. SCSIO 43136 TaxID=2819101 RepID=UPI0020750E19|nr:BatD family protein [Vibrio sp. SCSIO 43136]USD67166.1 BatD family protein [Vibrio sp. SCSIO 43136]
MVKNRTLHLLFTALIFALGLLNITQAMATPVATASVSKTKLNKDEIFQLKVTVNTRVDSAALDLTALEEDFALTRPSFGSYQNSINGRTSIRSEWSIALAPKRLGVITIPEFDIGGAKTKAIALQVSQEANAITQDDLVEYYAEVTKPSLYLGEQTELTTKLIIKTDPRRLQNSELKAPHAQGLTVHPESEANQYQTVIDGMEATVVEQVFTVRADSVGDHLLYPPQLTGAIVERNRYGSTRLIQIDKAASPVTVTVKDKPADYTDVWLPTDSLTMTQLWQDESGHQISSDAVTVDVGAVLTRTIQVTANNIAQEQMPAVNIEYPAAFRLYPEAPQFHNDSGKTVMTIKTVVIANQAGEWTLPSASIPWWDTVNEQRQSAQVAPLNVTVKQGEPTSLPLSENNDAPTTPPQVITTNDPGAWPYLTALFAMAWLISTFAWLKARNKPVQEHSPVKNNAESNGSVETLIEAINNKDGVRFNHHYQIWRLQSQGIKQDTELEKLVEHFMASLYQSTKSNYDPLPLIHKLKAIDKQAKTKNSPPTLPKL